MTCSIRKTSAISAGLLLSLIAGGCQVAAPLGPDQVNTTPIQLDEAMAHRLWPQSQCPYPSFSSTTGPSEVTLVPAPSNKPEWNFAVEPALFFVNTLLLPVAMIQTNPYAQVESPGYYLPPSYTANPPTNSSRADIYAGRTDSGYVFAPGRAVRYDAN